jgi:hypothetical protein
VCARRGGVLERCRVQAVGRIELARQLRIADNEELHAEGESEVSATRLLGVSALLMGTSIALSASANTPVPASITLKVYRFGLSTSPTCEDMTIYTIDAPDFVDFTTNPTLGSAAVPNGTYHCVALEIDPVVTITPKAAQGACTTEPQQADFCQALALIKELPPPDNVIDGVQPLGEDASEVFDTCPSPGTKFVIYLTTQIASGAMSNAFRAPTSPSDTAHGHPLGAPLVVGPKTTGTFVVTMNAFDDEGACVQENPSFTFESTNE